jgi:hypothetical protein
MKAETHNQLQGQALTVLVMDMVRADIEAGRECTLWSIARNVADRYQLNERLRNMVYRRIDHQVRALEAAGLITTEKKWNVINQVFVKHIRTCSGE